ncbi:MAG: UTP--glucose-1-phosphate uridylyltransferase GalU [Clostridia bacterium]|nr:UTP--glucose-1-phosphate uridylyltransferase GalU [Clostridia bacterium]
MEITKAVIPAAGFGTRFLPATKALPKEMLPIVDTPTIQYIVEEAVNAGITEIVIVISKSKTAIQNHFKPYPELEELLEKKGKTDFLKAVKRSSNLAKIHYVEQKQMLGLGHAILQAKDIINGEPFAILLGDDVVYNEDNKKNATKQLIDIAVEKNASVLGVQRVVQSDISKFGIVDIKERISGYKDRLCTVNTLVEKPKVEDAPSDIAILGRYVVTPEVFAELEKTEPGAGGEIQLTDALKTLATKQDMYAYDFEGKRYDVGNKMGFLMATVETALNRDDLKNEFIEYLKGIVNAF